MNIALIKYYARLIKKGIYTIDNVPEDKRDYVKKMMEEIPDIPFDPVTQTPEITGEIKTEDEKE